jgi:uncharacterized protein (DUF433 family)
VSSSIFWFLKLHHKDQALTGCLSNFSAIGAILDFEIDMVFTRITVDPNKMGGVPCIRGLRIPVATVVGMVADGMTDAEILEAYPDLVAEDIREALRYAAEAVREPELPLLTPA